MKFTLPDEVHSWCWSADYVNQHDREERQKAGENQLILPPGVKSSLDKDQEAVVHFSRMSEYGEEKSWLWLFRNLNEAVALRVFPNVPIHAPSAEILWLKDLVEHTIPNNQTKSDIIARRIPLRSFLAMALEENDVQEVWWGFDRHTFARSRNLSSATTKIEVKDFLKYCRNAHSY